MLSRHLSAYRTVFLNLPWHDVHLCSKTFNGSPFLESRSSSLRPWQPKASLRNTILTSVPIALHAPSLVHPFMPPWLCPGRAGLQESPVPTTEIPLRCSRPASAVPWPPRLLPQLPLSLFPTPNAPLSWPHCSYFMVVLFKSNFHGRLVGVLCPHSVRSFSKAGPCVIFIATSFYVLHIVGA